MGPADLGDVEGVVALALLVVITGLPLVWLAGLAVAGLKGKHLIVAVGFIGIPVGSFIGVPAPWAAFLARFASR
jgi:hypothetical protein